MTQIKLKADSKFNLVGTYVSASQTTKLAGATINNITNFFCTGKITSAPKDNDLKSFQALDLITDRLAKALCVSKPLQTTTTFYSPWVYAPNGITSSLNFVQGIGAGTTKNTYTIVGTYGQLNNGAVGVVYQGAINGTNTTQGSGPGSWTTMVVPPSFGSLGTSIYGVHKIANGKFNLVGAYVSASQTTNVAGTTINNTLGFYYTGKITSTPKDNDFKSFQARDPITGSLANETYLHSVSGGLAAGNYDFLGEGKGTGTAFVVDIKTGKQTNLRYNDSALSHSVYGIWSNSNRNYTVAGGESSVLGSLKPGINNGPSIGDATLADYDSITGQVTNTHTYRYPGQGGSSYETHFEGIWSDGKGLYKLPFWAFGPSDLSVSGLAIVKREKNGDFSSEASWITFDNPAGYNRFASSVWDEASLGSLPNSSDPSQPPSSYAALTHIF